MHCAQPVLQMSTLGGRQPSQGGGAMGGVDGVIQMTLRTYSSVGNNMLGRDEWREVSMYGQPGESHAGRLPRWRL